MKKIIVVLVAFLFLFSMSAVSFAQSAAKPSPKKQEARNEMFKGRITSIDAGKNEIVVTSKTGTAKTIGVEAKTLSSLKVDDEVRVTLNPGSNTALKVKKITKPAAPAKK